MFGARRSTPIDRDLNKKIVKLIHSLLTVEESAAFRKPVPHKALGLEDYKLVIKKPTDLNLIRRQNNDGKYKFLEEILDEVQLCWDNCKLYNPIDSQIYMQANFMQQTFDKLGIDLFPQSWEGIDREDLNRKEKEKKNQQERLKKCDSKPKKDKNALIDFSLENIKSKSHRRSSPLEKESFEEIEPEIQIIQIEIEPKGSILKNKSSENVQKACEAVDHVSVGAHQAENESGEENLLQNNEFGVEAVDPIIVNLLQRPKVEELMELSKEVEVLYSRQEMQVLEKVLEVLHQNQKEHMMISKSGQMTFRMDQIHISTFYRIKKALGIEQQLNLIE